MFHFSVNDDDLDLQMNTPNCNLSNFFHHPGYMNSPIESMCNGSEGDDDDRAYTRHQGTVHLWQFIRELLDQPKQYGTCVRWVERDEGTFKIESSLLPARYWGQRKNGSQMNYDKLSRSLRQYYKKGNGSSSDLFINQFNFRNNPKAREEATTGLQIPASLQLVVI